MLNNESNILKVSKSIRYRLVVFDTTMTLNFNPRSGDLVAWRNFACAKRLPFPLTPWRSLQCLWSHAGLRSGFTIPCFPAGDSPFIGGAVPEVRAVTMKLCAYSPPERAAGPAAEKLRRRRPRAPIDKPSENRLPSLLWRHDSIEAKMCAEKHTERWISIRIPGLRSVRDVSLWILLPLLMEEF
jgi:hypothetical protein